MACFGQFEVFHFKKCDYKRVETDGDYKWQKFSERIRFMETEYKSEPVFGVVCNHGDILIGQK
jgi:hypothetical protein